MMSAEDAIKNGDPVAAKEQVMDLIRNDPANVKHRILLFQLSCILGDYDRALNQLTVIGEMSDQALAMVQTYRELIQCDQLRRSVFEGKKTPLVFGEPEAWMGDVLESLKLQAMGKYEEANDIRMKAYEQVDVRSGSINGEPFEWLADADSRLWPVVEAVINGKYYWVPMNRIANIAIDAPEDLRDFVWLPVQFTWVNEGQAIGFIPVRYPESEASEDGMIKMAKKTEWNQVYENVYEGLGQKMLASESQDFALLDIRTIEFTS